MTRSATVPRLMAASTPSGIAMTVTDTRDVTASEAEFQNASPTTSATGNDRRSDWPRSPRKMPPIQSRY